MSITILLDGGSKTETWVDRNIFDGVSIKAIAEVTMFLEETYTPVYHGHPSHGVEYNEYVWEDN